LGWNFPSEKSQIFEGGLMRKYTANEIVAALEKIDELLRQGVPAAEAVQTLGITAVTYYRWRKQFGGLSDD
jgi:hypothetical protein